MKNFGFTVGLAYFFFSYLNLSYFGLSYVILLYVLSSYLVYQYIPKDSLLVNGMGTHKLQIQSRSAGLPPFMDYLLGVCVCGFSLTWIICTYEYMYILFFVYILDMSLYIYNDLFMYILFKNNNNNAKIYKYNRSPCKTMKKTCLYSID